MTLRTGNEPRKYLALRGGGVLPCPHWDFRRPTGTGWVFRVFLQLELTGGRILTLWELPRSLEACRWKGLWQSYPSLLPFSPAYDTNNMSALLQPLPPITP